MRDQSARKQIKNQNGRYPDSRKMSLLKTKYRGQNILPDIDEVEELMATRQLH